MTISPMLWGAGLACALGGAIAGNALGSSPVTDRGAIESFYQMHESARRNSKGQRALPDHYPLVTRTGVVPVAQLSDRGLFSQRRYRPLDTFPDYPVPNASDSPGQSVVQAVETVEMSAVPSEPARPLALANGPAQVMGHAKIIHVQASLAMR